MNAKVDWFERGKQAFSAGLPRFIKDSRLSNKDRAAWYAGWNSQSQTNGIANLAPDARTDLADGIADILKCIREIPEPAKPIPTRPSNSTAF